MIIVKNRELLIPNNERYIGTTYDTETENRIFQVPRYSQRGVDLAALTFRLDIQYANESYDTIVLDKEIGEAFVILIWRITSSTLQVPGTMYIGLRAVDNEATVKWSSFSAAMYVERHLNTPGNYGGSLTEIEQMEQDHQYMLSVVNDLKANLDYAHDAEAWAQGTRNGSAVPSSDKTYQKNSKYYSEQANASKNAAANSATAAAGSATAAHDDSEAVAASRAQIAQNASNIAIQTARIDQFTHLAEGSTTGDAELMDARVGADGVTYTSAGAATRANDSLLKSQIDAIDSAVDNYVIVTHSRNLYDPSAASEHKYLNIAGYITDYDPTSVTDYIPVIVGKYATFSNAVFSGRAALQVNSYLFYDSRKQFIANSGSTWKSSALVPSGAAYIRVCFGATITDLQVELTNDGVFTDYVLYSTTYDLNENINVSAEQVHGIADAIEKVSVKGTNLVTNENSGVGSYYYDNGITHDATATSLRYVIVDLKPNTRYFVTLACRFWIFTDENDNVLSYGNFSLGAFFFDSGSAKKLYYTVYGSEFDAVGLIIAEGYSGTKAAMLKPDFIQGLNQLNNDSWFAVALTPNSLRFTVGISEKLYYFNILALEKNTIDLSLLGTSEDDGFLVPADQATSYSNVYGYTVYDDDLSVVANMPRGGNNRLYIYADNISNCSALLIGDSIIARNSAKIGQTMLNAFAERNKTLTLLGTLGTGANKHEGRSGWTSAQYFTDATYEGVVNPFYNPTTETFDFGYYMTNQGYASVDFVVIHLGGNDLFGTDFSAARAKINATEDNICAMIESILEWNATQKIIIELAPSTSTNSNYISKVDQKLVRAKFTTYNAEMLVILTKYPTVRCSNDYMIVNPATELADHIHPTDEGLAKIGMELVSQINCWQNQT